MLSRTCPVTFLDYFVSSCDIRPTIKHSRAANKFLGDFRRCDTHLSLQDFCAFLRYIVYVWTRAIFGRALIN